MIKSRPTAIKSAASLDTILAANKPFELRPQYPTNKGILLIHGLLSCPLAVHDIAQDLKEQGFLARSILLPGHGTQAQDLDSVDRHDWLAAVKFGIQSLKQQVDEIWIGGLSGGASLALATALQDPTIRGSILIAPSLRLRNPLARFSTLLQKLNAYFNWDYWPEKEAETDYAKYHSFPMHFATQAHILAQTVRHMSQTIPLNSPLFMVLSADDETICSKTALQFFLQQKNPHNRLIWYGEPPKKVSDTRIIYRSSQHLDENILNYSHACLTISPQNKHYGLPADYLTTLHIPTQPLADVQEYYGALTAFNLKNYKIRRLMYNPDYAFMIQQMHQFLTN